MFGSILKKLRTQKGLSQENIAKELYVVRQTVSKWESGQSSPGVDQLRQLSIILDVPIEDFLETNEEFTSNQNINNCLAATKKEEMITTIKNRLEAMNETGVKTLFDIVMCIPDRERWMAATTPERIAELDAINTQRDREEKLTQEKADKIAQQKENANRNQILHDYARMFNAIETLDMPTRYDLCIGEIMAIDYVCGGVSHCFPEYAYSVSGYYFKYGFVKGIRYAKAQAKKKQKKTTSPTIN